MRIHYCPKAEDYEIGLENTKTVFILFHFIYSLFYSL